MKVKKMNLVMKNLIMTRTRMVTTMTIVEDGNGDGGYLHSRKAMVVQGTDTLVGGMSGDE